MLTAQRNVLGKAKLFRNARSEMRRHMLADRANMPHIPPPIENEGLFLRAQIIISFATRPGKAGSNDSSRERLVCRTWHIC